MTKFSWGALLFYTVLCLYKWIFFFARKVVAQTAVDESVWNWYSWSCFESMLLTRLKRINAEWYGMAWSSLFSKMVNTHIYYFNATQHSAEKHKSITIYLLRIYLLSPWQCVCVVVPAVFHNSQTHAYSPKVIRIFPEAEFGLCMRVRAGVLSDTP